MKTNSNFGIYDFSDFAEELDEQQLFAVNGGTNYGQCGGGNIEKYTKETGKTLTTIDLVGAMAKAVNSADADIILYAIDNKVKDA